MYRVGDVVSFSGILVKYSISLEIVTIAYPGITEANYPFCFYPLDISPLGEGGYMPAHHLPFDDPNYITGLTPSMLCVHRRTNQQCRIRYDNLFPINGSFTLTPIDGSEAKSCTSKKWTLPLIKAYLESIKGRELKITATIGYIYDEEKQQFHKGMVPNKVIVARNKKIFFFLVFPDGSIERFPGALFLEETQAVTVKEKSTYDTAKMGQKSGYNADYYSDKNKRR